jgi:serine/threonine-protein kinase SRPK3
MLVAPIRNSKMWDATLLQETIVVGDFGQSYIVASPPPSYQPGTMLNYQSTEARFEGRAGLEADIWALGCAIFEIRAGVALFDRSFGGDVIMLMQMVETLGRLPDPWWAGFEQRALWFEEDGQPKSERDQRSAGMRLMAHKTSIRERLLRIGKRDSPPSEDEGPMIEKPGVQLRGEVELLEDLLGKMLRYRPEERICIQDVLRHPWFHPEGMSPGFECRWSGLHTWRFTQRQF